MWGAGTCAKGVPMESRLPASVSPKGLPPPRARPTRRAGHILRERALRVEEGPRLRGGREPVLRPGEEGLKEKEPKRECPEKEYPGKECAEKECPEKEYPEKESPEKKYPGKEGPVQKKRRGKAPAEINQIEKNPRQSRYPVKRLRKNPWRKVWRARRGIRRESRPKRKAQSSWPSCAGC